MINATAASAEASFSDEAGTPENPREETVTFSIVATDNNAIEGELQANSTDKDAVTFDITRSVNNGVDSTVKFSLSSEAAVDFVAADIASIVVTVGGVSTTIADIAAFLANGYQITLSGEASASVTLTPVDDSILENRELFIATLDAVTDGNAVAALLSCDP